MNFKEHILEESAKYKIQEFQQEIFENKMS